MLNTLRKTIILILSTSFIGISFAIAYSNHDLYQLKISEFFDTITLFTLLESIAVITLFLLGIGIYILFFINLTKKAFK